jgi:outer membrane protein TolC
MLSSWSRLRSGWRTPTCAALNESSRCSRRNIEVQSKTATLVQNQLRTGIASEIDFDGARSQLTRTQAQEPLLQAAIDIATYRLAVLTGRMPVKSRTR